MPQLIIEQPGVPPITVPLSGKDIQFGRSEDNDFVLVADEVSRHHAKICHRNGKDLLVDLKSLNGTYVNRQRVVERLLSHMDEIWFGSKCRMVYRDDTHFGKQEQTPARPPTESGLARNIDNIRADMERVGNTMMTMIGGSAMPQAARTMVGQQTSAEDLVKMGRAYRRLAALHKASKIMAEKFDLGGRLAKVLDLVLEVMDAERGFVMLREEGTDSLRVEVARGMGGKLEASSPSMGIAGRAAIDGEEVLMADSQTDQEFGMRDSIIRGAIMSAMCVPLKLDDRILGSIYIDTRKQGVKFADEDLELFASLASQSAMAIDNVKLHERAVEAEKRRQQLGRFLSPAIVNKIMDDQGSVQLGGQRTRVTTLFCDVRGFTNLAERIPPPVLVELLNEYFTAMTNIIFEMQGTLDKYVGDAIMAVFGAPYSAGDDAFRAVKAAVAMQERNTELNLERERDGRPTIELGIGVETGEVTAGYFGSPQRMEFTVIGDRVNTASRLCGIAGAGKVVVGDETWREVQSRAIGKPLGTVVLKGKELPVHAYEVSALRDPNVL